MLQERFWNTQSLIAAHMDDLVEIPKVNNITEVSKLRVMFDKLETNGYLKYLKVETATYGTLLINIIFERIPYERRIIISRCFNDENWNLDELMRLFKAELYA